MSSEFQRLVDSLGRSRGRTLAIDDSDFCLIAYDSRSGEPDQARIESTMRREVSAEVLDYLRQAGAARRVCSTESGLG